APQAGRRSAGLVARSLFQLTKPRIIELLLVTTVPTMLLAQRGLPSVKLLAATLLGGALAAGSANTLNCYIDRDIDALMRRTSRRPLVARGGQAAIRPAEALISGIVLGAASTLPHFWALAMKFRDDYAAASVPMLPVVASAATVARKILVYSYLMVAATLALVPYSGWLYGGCAAVLGVWFLAEAHRLRGRVAAGESAAPMRLFHLSIAYLTLLFVAVAVTALIPWGRW